MDLHFYKLTARDSEISRFDRINRNYSFSGNFLYKMRERVDEDKVMRRRDKRQAKKQRQEKEKREGKQRDETRREKEKGNKKR